MSAIIEAPSELFYVESLATDKVSARLKAEGVSLLLKSISIFLLLRLEMGLMAYALSSLLYSISLNVIYFLILPNALSMTKETTVTSE